jgi:hypothetical protein
MENNEDELAEIAGSLLCIIHASGYQADAVVVQIKLELISKK